MCFHASVLHWKSFELYAVAPRMWTICLLWQFQPLKLLQDVWVINQNSVVLYSIWLWMEFRAKMKIKWKLVFSKILRWVKRLQVEQDSLARPLSSNCSCHISYFYLFFFLGRMFHSTHTKKYYLNLPQKLVLQCHVERSFVMT